MWGIFGEVSAGTGDRRRIIGHRLKRSIGPVRQGSLCTSTSRRRIFPGMLTFKQLEALQGFRSTLQKEGLVGEYANPEDIGYQVRQAIEHDLAELTLADPAPPTGAAGALLRSRHHYEKTMSGKDTKNKPKFSTMSLLVLENAGTQTAEAVTLEIVPVNEGDQFRFDGPSSPFDLLPKAERDWPFIPLMGREVTVRARWTEGDHQHAEDQTISL